MFLIRRISKVKWGKEWEAARYLYELTKAQESAGRSESRVYLTGLGTPPVIGSERTITVDWVTEKIESSVPPKSPEAAKAAFAKLAPLLDAYYIEFHEVVTAQKLRDRGFSV